MTLQMKTFVVGPLDTNAYVIWDDGSKECWVVDPSLWPKNLLAWLAAEEMAVAGILLTHAHGDHIGGVADLKEVWPEAQLHCPASETEMLADPVKNLSSNFMLHLTSPPADVLLEAGEVLIVAGVPCHVLDTSGHTVGGVSFYIPTAGWAFTGDALFAGSVGRTDIPDGNHEALIANIKTALLTLPDETKVFPGHGPKSTIGDETNCNMFL
jgi:hydroxyacylglutathione hydrolase